MVKVLGAVDGTREVCDLLMEAEKPILVYPGGAYEAFKKKTDKKYELLWKDRLGFARMAIKHAYTIIPCCAVGSEDLLEIVQDIPVEWLRAGHSIPVIKPPSPNQLQKVCSSPYSLLWKSN